MLSVLIRFQVPLAGINLKLANGSLATEHLFDCTGTRCVGGSSTGECSMLGDFIA